MRLTKQDPTGSYSYLNDGFSPASDVLTDGYSTFTPGISETKGAAGGGYASEFYLADASGNSRGLLNGSGSATDGYNWDAFGTLMSRFGSNPTMFAWNEASGYQSDNDDGLTLLGHRYYDKRTGRFISQDPAGDGDNWYGYAGNDPMNGTDPSGLDTLSKTDLFWMMYTSGDYNGGDYHYFSSGGIYWTNADGTGGAIGSQSIDIPSGSGGQNGFDMGGVMGQGGGMGMGVGIIGGFNPGDGHDYHYTDSLNEHGEHVHQDSKTGLRFNRDGKHVDAHDNPIKGSKRNISSRFMDEFRKGFDREIQTFRQRVQDAVNKADESYKQEEQRENSYKTNEERLEEMGYNPDGSMIEPEGELPIDFIP